MSDTGLKLMRAAFESLLEAYEIMIDTGELFSQQHLDLVDKIENQLDLLLYLEGRDKRAAGLTE